LDSLHIHPFGATFGDFFTKPITKGLDLGTLSASMVSLILMSLLIIVSHRASTRTIFNYKPKLNKMLHRKNWHQKHHETLEFGNRLADAVANSMGSWRFIIVQTILVILWMGLNTIALIQHWDVYPFILLNLVFSTQAAYAAPIIMMSQNRQNERIEYMHRQITKPIWMRSSKSSN
jgi:hypothetical protein